MLIWHNEGNMNKKDQDQNGFITMIVVMIIIIVSIIVLAYMRVSSVAK